MKRHRTPTTHPAVAWLLALLLVLVVALAVVVTTARAGTPKHRALWLCIYKNERSGWHDPNAPYYGGLQMGWWFMRTYASGELRRYGTADHWPPSLQMAVAERAYRREGFSYGWLRGQWPNTLYGPLGSCTRHA